MGSIRLECDLFHYMTSIVNDGVGMCNHSSFLAELTYLVLVVLGSGNVGVGILGVRGLCWRLLVGVGYSRLAMTFPVFNIIDYLL